MIAGIFLVLISIVWGYAVFWYGGVVREDRHVYLLALGTVALGYWLANRGRMAPAPKGALGWAILVLPAYAALQLVPLPVRVLEILSPGRAELVRAFNAIGPGERFAPLSVLPDAGMQHLMLVCGYTLLFLLARDIGWRFSERIWVTTGPIVVIGVLEALLGLTQALSGRDGRRAVGTYVNGDHFAGLLEMTLPFALMYAISIWRTPDRWDDFQLRAAVKICVFLLLSAVILLGVIYSLSRMGFTAALLSLLVMGIVARVGGGKRSLFFIGLLIAGLLVCLVFLPPDQFIERFSQWAAPEGITANDRLLLWRESFGVFRAFPAFGCGLGGYESVFMRYKVTFPMAADDYAHNDYLQFLIELGLVGFAMGAVLFWGIVKRALSVVSQRDDPDKRYLAIACTGALAAIGIHSFVDFNLYTPANAMLLAWISGLCASLPVLADGQFVRGKAALLNVPDIAMAPEGPTRRGQSFKAFIISNLILKIT